jgi:hypothetical protein
MLEAVQNQLTAGSYLRFQEIHQSGRKSQWISSVPVGYHFQDAPSNLSSFQLMKLVTNLTFEGRSHIVESHDELLFDPTASIHRSVCLV